MPTAYKDNIDDPLVFDGQQEFRGQASFVKESLLKPHQLAVLLNGLLTTKGTVISRPGRVQIGTEGRAPAPIQGLGYFDRPGEEKLFRVRANKVEYTGSVDVNSHLVFPWTDTGFRVTDDAEVEFVQLANKFYLTDGSQLYQWTGSTFDALEDVPAVLGLARMQGRIFGAVNGTFDDYLYESDVLDGSVWQASIRSLRIGEGEGDPIVALTPWYQNVLLVAKQSSLITVRVPAGATSMSDYIIERIPGDYGCVARRTLTSVGNDIWFLSRDGVRSVRRMAAQADQEVSLPISEPIKDVISRINPRAIGTSCAFHIDNLFCLAVPLKDATAPNAVILYNTLTKEWSGAIPGWYPTAWHVTNFDGRQRVVFGDGWGRVHWWRLGDDYYRDHSNAPAPQYSTVPSSETIADGTLSESVGTGEVWEKISNGATQDATYLPDPETINTEIGERRTSLMRIGPSASWDNLPPMGIVTVIPDPPPEAGQPAQPSPDVGTVTSVVDQRWRLVEKEWYFTTIVTRAYTFNDPMSRKTGDRLELEFRGSLAEVEIFARRDGGAWVRVPPADWDGRTSGASAALPQTLPFNLANETSKRKRWNLLPLGQWREIQIKVVAIADKVQLREIFLSAWIEALEGER